MKNKLLVIDIETLGLQARHPICEIGAALLDPASGEVTPVFHQLVAEEAYLKDTQGYKNAWIFHHSTLKPKDIREKGLPIAQFYKVLQGLFDEHFVTAYNARFDVSFLKERGFRFPRLSKCPMLVATNVLKLPSSRGFKYPSVQECLDYFQIQEIEPHRALEDAMLEAKVIYELMKLNAYMIGSSQAVGIQAFGVGAPLDFQVDNFYM